MKNFALLLILCALWIVSVKLFSRTEVDDEAGNVDPIPMQVEKPRHFRPFPEGPKSKKDVAQQSLLTESPSPTSATRSRIGKSQRSGETRNTASLANVSSVQTLLLKNQLELDQFLRRDLKLPEEKIQNLYEINRHYNEKIDRFINSKRLNPIVRDQEIRKLAHSQERKLKRILGSVGQDRYEELVTKQEEEVDRLSLR